MERSTRTAAADAAAAVFGVSWGASESVSVRQSRASSARVAANIGDFKSYPMDLPHFEYDPSLGPGGR